MRMSGLFLVSFVCSTLLGCSSMNTTHHPSQTTKTNQPTKTVSALTKKKDPIQVSFYPAGKNPAHPYTVIGEAAVSNYNTGGIKRQDAVIHDAMRTVAASMGGDAVIDVKRTDKLVVGKIIVWQPKVFV